MPAYLWIDGHKRGLCFSAAHWIEGHEKCDRIHGHEYYVSIKIYGKIMDDGVIVDFSLVKKKVEEIIEELDHRILVPRSKVIREQGKLLIVKKGDLEISLPKEDCKILDVRNVTAEELAEYIADRLYESLFKDLGERVYQFEVGVDEGGGQEAWAERKLYV